MPIEKGKDWGGPGSLPDTTGLAKTDAEVAQAIQAGERFVRPTDGDLARTLGVSAASVQRPAATLLPVDAIAVDVDGTTYTAAAHVIVGRRWRPDIAVMNAAFLGTWNVAPRAHPGDERFDVVTFELGAVDWFKARRRLPTGTHVPHPAIRIRAMREWTETFDSPQPVAIDGVRIGRAATVSLRILPDAIIAGV